MGVTGLGHQGGGGGSHFLLCKSHVLEGGGGNLSLGGMCARLVVRRMPAEAGIPKGWQVIPTSQESKSNALTCNRPRTTFHSSSCKPHIR
jgi:hypothetical protein